jgi:hypothetical protein
MIPALKITLAALFATGLALPALAQTPASITTPDRLETRLGTLDFKDGAPSKETVEKVYDNLDFMHASEAFLDAFRGASLVAARKGMISAGVEDNAVIIFSELMDAKSLFLTANADTPYFISFIDLSKGPMVVETPPLSLGAFDDMWFRWVIDFGLPGPDRGAGGKYLLVPPGYTGDLPDSGFHVAQSRTTRVLLMGRSFLENNDPKPPVELIKTTLKIYRYQPGGFGTSIATGLDGKVPLLRSPDGTLDWAFLRPQPSAKFIEGSGRVMNTVPPNEYSYFETINELVQAEPANAMDAEVMGSLAAIGIVKGKPFAPDARMRGILTDAVKTANATARALVFNPRESEGFYYYPGSAWQNSLWVGGYEFETPPPQLSSDGVSKPYPPTGVRTLDSRTAWFYYATGITPAMIMRLPDIGSQYVWAFTDADKNYLDGSKTYKVTHLFRRLSCSMAACSRPQRSAPACLICWRPGMGGSRSANCKVSSQTSPSHSVPPSMGVTAPLAGAFASRPARRGPITSAWRPPCPPFRATSRRSRRCALSRRACRKARNC